MRPGLTGREKKGNIYEEIAGKGYPAFPVSEVVFGDRLWPFLLKPKSRILIGFKSVMLKIFKYIICLAVFCRILVPFEGMVPHSLLYAYKISDLDLDFQSTVTHIYNDNITSAQNDKKSDHSTNVSLGVAVNWEDKHRALNFSANIAHEFFYEYDNYDDTTENFTINFLNEFSEYERLSASNSFSHTYEPITFEDAFGREKGHYSYYKNRFSIGYEKDMTKQVSLGASYGCDMDEVSQEGSSDSSMHRVGFQGQYFASTSLIFLASYDFSHREFDPGADASTNMVSVGLRKFITSQLYFDGTTGIQFLKSYNKKNYTKPHIFLLLTNELDQSAQIRLSYTKQYYTNAYTQDLFDYWQTQAEVSRQFFERLGGTASIFYGEGEYISFDIKDEVSGIAAGLNYDFRENMKGSLTYRYSKTDSTVDSREYSQNKVIAGVTIGF